jgi:cytochrome b561
MEKIDGTSIALHWIVAAAMIGLLAMGFYMVTNEAWGLFELHKSMGVGTFLVIILRVIWTTRNGLPEQRQDLPPSQRLLASTVHWVLLIGTLAMPISGMLFSACSGHHVGIFGLELYPANVAPGNPDEAISRSPFWEAAMQNTHQCIGYLLVLTILLHVAGALKHHFVDKDATLRRMLGK